MRKNDRFRRSLRNATNNRLSRMCHRDGENDITDFNDNRAYLTKGKPVLPEVSGTVADDAGYV